MSHLWEVLVPCPAQVWKVQVIRVSTTVIYKLYKAMSRTTLSVLLLKCGKCWEEGLIHKSMIRVNCHCHYHFASPRNGQVFNLTMPPAKALSSSISISPSNQYNTWIHNLKIRKNKTKISVKCYSNDTYGAAISLSGEAVDEITVSTHENTWVHAWPRFVICLTANANIWRQ